MSDPFRGGRSVPWSVDRPAESRPDGLTGRHSIGISHSVTVDDDAMTTRKQALVWTATVAAGTALLGLGTIAVAAHLETADHIAGVIGALAALVALGPVAHRVIARRAAGTPGPAAVTADAGDADSVVDAPDDAPSGAPISRNSIQGSMVVNGNVDIRHQPPARRSHHVLVVVAGVVITVLVVGQFGSLSPWPATDSPPAADPPSRVSSGERTPASPYA